MGKKPAPQYINVQEAVAILLQNGIEVVDRTVVNWINGGEFPGAFKVNPSAHNSPWLIPYNELEGFISRNTQHA